MTWFLYEIPSIKCSCPQQELTPPDSSIECSSRRLRDLLKENFVVPLNAKYSSFSQLGAIFSFKNLNWLGSTRPPPQVFEVFTERTLCPRIVHCAWKRINEELCKILNEWMSWRGFGGAPDYYNGVALVVTLCIDTAHCSTGLIKFLWYSWHLQDEDICRNTFDRRKCQGKHSIWYSYSQPLLNTFA